MTDAAPQVGDIVSYRFCERRARVTHVYPNGAVRLRTVVLIGDAWRDKHHGMSSTCSVYSFAKNYRLLARANG